jgi:hypothetical protein
MKSASGASEGSDEKETYLVAPLLRVVGISPGIPDVKERKVISAGLDKVSMSSFGMDLLVFRTVEEGGAFLQHRDDGEDLRRRKSSSTRETDSAI